MADRDASETSPLLGESPTILPKDGNPPHGLSMASNDTGGFVSGRSKPPIDEENHEELSRDSQFNGLPEVKQKLKYILPAITIGVRAYLHL